MILSQPKYARDLLQKAEMSLQLQKIFLHLFQGNSNFLNVGLLWSMSVSRPEIGYPMKVCQFTAHHLQSHWAYVKRILKYLKGTPDFGHVLQPAFNASPIC